MLQEFNALLGKLKWPAIAISIFLLVTLSEAFHRYAPVATKEYDNQTIVFVLDQLTGQVCANAFYRYGQQRDSYWRQFDKKNFRTCVPP